jgi:hypothetical protein
MSKNTAIEWLVTELRNRIAEGTLDAIAISKLKMEAKAMECEQMIQAYSNGWHDGQDVILQQCKHIDKGGDDAGNQYYNETYKGGSNE